MVSYFMILEVCIWVTTLVMVGVFLLSCLGSRRGASAVSCLIKSFPMARSDPSLCVYPAGQALRPLWSGPGNVPSFSRFARAVTVAVTQTTLVWVAALSTVTWIVERMVEVSTLTTTTVATWVAVQREV